VPVVMDTANPVASFGTVALAMEEPANQRAQVTTSVCPSRSADRYCLTTVTSPLLAS